VVFVAGGVTLALVGASAAFAWVDDAPLVPIQGGLLVGDTAWAWAFLVCAALALVSYAAGLALLRRRGSRLAAVVGLAVAIQVTPLAAPLLLSSDAYTYWSYGRIAAVHGGNPYVQPPEAYPDDPSFPWVGADWRDTTSVYAPGFTLASEPVALAAGESHDRVAWFFKALAAAAMVAASLLAARLGSAPAFAAAFVGWNPVLALHLAGGGHNDAWIAGLVLAALALAQAGRGRYAGVVWALAVLVKWVPLIFLPLRALEARRTGRHLVHSGTIATAAVVLGVATWQFGLHWLDAFQPLVRNAGLQTRFAIPSRLEQLGMPEDAAVALLAVAFAAAYAWLLREAWRGRARLGLAAGLLLLAVPYLAPWYLAWTVPLAAVEDDGAARWLSLGLCAYLLPQTIPI
jgi:alpha-1,6-mannosyltransferase